MAATTRHTWPALGLATLLTGTLLLTGCGSEESPGGDAGETTGVNPTSEPTETTEPTETSEPDESHDPSGVPEDVVDQSIDLLAQQIAVDPSEITVMHAMPVTWRDGSIGCAKKGMGYTEALVPGYVVELTADGKTYAFHQGNETSPPFYCKKPTEEYMTDGASS